MRKRLILGAGVAIFGGILIKRRRNAVSSSPLASNAVARAPQPLAQRQRGHLILLQAMLHFIAVSLFWPWDGIVDGASGVIREVKNLIRDAINSVYSYITSGFSYLWNLYDTVRQTGQAVWDNLFKFVKDLVDGVTAWAYTLILHTYNVLDEGVNFVKHYAESLFNQAMNYAGIILSDLSNFIVNRVQWVYDNWIAPLKDATFKILGWVGEQINNAINWVNANLIQPVLGVARDALNLASQLWDWFTRVARNAVELVIKASWFLSFIVTHGPDFWVQWVNDQVRRMPSLIASWAEDSVTKEGGWIENWIVRWLGV